MAETKENAPTATATAVPEAALPAEAAPAPEVVASAENGVANPETVAAAKPEAETPAANTETTAANPETTAAKTETPAEAETTTFRSAAPAAASPASVPADAEVITPGWPALPPTHDLVKLHARLPSILEAAGHTKIWGVTLSAASPPAFSTLLVLQKYLRSTSGDVDLAAKNLEATLKWRKEFGLDQAEDIKIEGGEAFDGLGYVTEVTHPQREVVTWNVYGAVKSLQETFGDLDKFLRWRVSLMERALARLHLSTTTTPIPDFGKGEDPHRVAQVHVYTGVSFLRMDPNVKAASKATIALMAAHYPETLSRKLFVGVPLLMSWVFSAVRVFVSAETAKKFVVISYPSNTAAELADDPADVPKEYGGTGPGLVELETRAEKA